MSRRTIRRILAAGLLLATVMVGASGGGATPVAAQPAPPVFISGNFIGDARDEVFAYRAGEPQDEYLVVFDNGGIPGGDLNGTVFPFNVNGTGYRPVAGDFDGDGRDEIFWHGPGTIPDSIWNFQSATSVTSVPYSVNGSYQPLAGDYTGDAVDDIHWYAAGTAPDYVWEFNAGGSFASVARNVNGTYRPVVASIGKDNTDDTLWYGPGSTPDSLWDWTRGTTSHTSQALSVVGTAYLPFRYDYFGEGWRGEDVYWYTQGPAGDPVWDYFLGQRFNLDEIASPYDDQFDVAVAGDYFGDGLMDILFITNADLTDFTLFDSSFEQDFVYDIRPTTASRASAGVTADAVPRAKTTR
jgi:hypothetical protein